MKDTLCTSKNGKTICYDPTNSHASTHFDDTPNLLELVVKVLSTRDIDNTNVDLEVDMQRIVGTTDVVETDPTDEIIYAYRKNRQDQGYVPFVKTRKAENSSFISISLIPQNDGSYKLSSAWIGKWDDPPFPQQSNATGESIDYWSTHAFVWGSQEIEVGSETDACPW